MRYCECGRELERYQHYCSECAYHRREITNDYCRNMHELKPERIKSKIEYQKQYKEKNREAHKIYMKNYHKKIATEKAV